MMEFEIKLSRMVVNIESQFITEKSFTSIADSIIHYLSWQSQFYDLFKIKLDYRENNVQCGIEVVQLKSLKSLKINIIESLSTFSCIHYEITTKKKNKNKNKHNIK